MRETQPKKNVCIEYNPKNDDCLQKKISRRKKEKRRDEKECYGR